MKRKNQGILSLIITAALMLSGCSSSGSEVILPDDSTVSTPFTEAEAKEPNDITAAKTPLVTEGQQPETSESKENSTSDIATEEAASDNQGGNFGNGQGSSDSSFEAEWINGNARESNGKYFGTIELKITNKSGSALKGWIVTFTIPDGFEISSCLQGKATVNGTAVTVTNESFNGDLANGASVTVGFQYSSSKPFNPPTRVTINGRFPSSDVSVDGYYGSIIDTGGHLTDSENSRITQELLNAVEKTNMNIIIYLCDDVGSDKSDYGVADHADLMYESICGINTDGILLMINFDTMYDYISTSGAAINYFSDSYLDEMFDYFYSDLVDERYADACCGFIDSVLHYYDLGKDNRF